jgi:Ca2+-binding RTX toxin-like protein
MAKSKGQPKVATSVLRRSTGPKVGNGDRVGVWYSGQLLDGTPFDSNYDFSTFTPRADRSLFSFQLGAGQVIAGWDQGLAKRRLGEVVELTIPAALAYGSAGSPPSIPPDAPLRFQVELIGRVARGANQATYASYEQLGIQTKAIGLTKALLATLESSKVGLDRSDTLVGGTTADLLIGLGGNDQLTGAAGADVLIGGKGTDIYRFTAAEDSAAADGQRDRILGFEKADRLDLSSLAAGGQFIGSTAFSGRSGEVRFAAGLLQLDATGDGLADLEVLIPGTKSLSSANLVF